MNDLTFVIIIGLLGLALGVVIGIMGSNLFSSKKDGEVPNEKPVLDYREGGLVPEAESWFHPKELNPQETVERPSMSPVDAIARALRPDSSKLESTPKSIAAQIDEILQEMLIDSLLSNKAIRLLELPQKGVVVVVGLEQYEGVESVPDPEIRGLIQKAVTEWEDRVTEQIP